MQKMNEAHIYGTKHLCPQLDNPLQFRFGRINEILIQKSVERKMSKVPNKRIYYKYPNI